MDVAELMLMIEKRKGKKSYEAFAREIGINTTTLFKMITDARKNKDRDLVISSVQKLVAYFEEQNDREMVGALVEYATGIKPDALVEVLSF